MKNLWTGAVAALLIGCTGGVDLSPQYAAYDAAFRQEHEQIVHAVPRDGFTLHAREFAPDGIEASDAPYILMHGFPDSLHLYDRLAPLLARKRRVITFDFLGWGNSDKPEGHRYDVASLRRDLEAVLAYFGLRRVRLVVHDASGLPGIDYAIDNPDRTVELILLNTLYAPPEKRIMPPSIKRFSTLGLRRDLLIFGAKRSDSLWRDGHAEQVGAFFADPAVRDKYLPIFSHQALGIRPAFFSLTGVWTAEVRARARRIAELRRLEVPTKIIFGAEDPYLNPALARELGHLIPNARLWLVESAGHYLQLDRPEEVARLVLGA